MTTDAILLVDDEEDLRAPLLEALNADGYSAEGAANAVDALERISRKHYPVIVTDLHMPGGPSGLDLISALKAVDPRALCVVITGYASLSVAIEALKGGAYDFIQKPFRLEELEAVLDRALEHARLQRHLEGYQKDLENRVLSRVAEMEAFHAEVLRLNTFLREALVAPSPTERFRPFLDYFHQRHAAQSLLLFLPKEDHLDLALQVGSLPTHTPAKLPAHLRVREAQEWTWEGGPRDGFLIPLHGNGPEPLGVLYLGFESRTAFHPEDPVSALCLRQLEALLQVPAPRP